MLMTRAKSLLSVLSCSPARLGPWRAGCGRRIGAGNRKRDDLDFAALRYFHPGRALLRIPITPVDVRHFRRSRSSTSARPLVVLGVLAAVDDAAARQVLLVEARLARARQADGDDDEAFVRPSRARFGGGDGAAGGGGETLRHGCAAGSSSAPRASDCWSRDFRHERRARVDLRALSTSSATTTMVGRTWSRRSQFGRPDLPLANISTDDRDVRPAKHRIGARPVPSSFSP